MGGVGFLLGGPGLGLIIASIALLGIFVSYFTGVSLGVYDAYRFSESPAQLRSNHLPFCQTLISPITEQPLLDCRLQWARIHF